MDDIVGGESARYYLLFALIPVFVLLFIYYDLIFRRKNQGTADELSKKSSSKENQLVKEKSSSGEITGKEAASKEAGSKEAGSKEAASKDSSPKKDKKAKKKKSKDKKSVSK